MSKQTDGKSENKFSAFLKKNIYYILMVVAVLSIVTMIVVAAVMSSNTDGAVDDPVISTPDNTKPDKPVEPKPEVPKKVFIMVKPVMAESIGLKFSEDELVFHPTQGAWKTHLGVDYMAKAGSEVVAVFDGTVSSVENDGYYGTTVVIEHMDGFKSVYKLLDKETMVKAGDVVKKGMPIGKVGNTSTFEVKQGEHLHFELMKDGKLVDPSLYFVEGDK